MRFYSILSSALLVLLLSNGLAQKLTLKACKQMCGRQQISRLSSKTCSAKATSSAARTASVSAGGVCSSDADCVEGYGCAASKTCNKIVENVDYYVWTNDYCEIFINGQYQGFVPSGFDVVKFTYSGTCDDIIMKVTNGYDYISSGIVMKYGGWNHASQGFHQAPNGIAIPIYGRAKLSPEGNFTNNDPSYDYMSWNEAVYAADMDQTGNFPQSMKDAGADPVTSDDVLTPLDTVMGIRYEFPECY
ncbi:hypothetical protein BWQ96_10174 [Gracilariopsis chorda]|uniref:Uncharacterized protein n=1 Tax=Gracilariopsis chorda TaxID=448386 RepID=A0A2V3IDF9_9FLOR|nr:hypothetical protein BWQ96_10174 [Gracilariopsis chorda]|eukprot:PXF40113.1 hypothetical protein BWQ96_10174 [Gracilariopsis chorda]